MLAHLSQSPDYLSITQKGNVTEDHREKLHSWIYNVCDMLNCCQNAKELAGNYVDNYLQVKHTKRSILQLLGIGSIQLAIKSCESFVVDIQTLAELCGNQYSPASIVRFEEILLHKLSWRTNVPTPSSQLLDIGKFIENYCQKLNAESIKDHTSLRLLEILRTENFKQKTNLFILIAILDYNLNRYGAFHIALMSVFGVLRSKGMSEEAFKFLEILQHNIPENILKVKEDAMRLFSLPLDESDSKLEYLFSKAVKEGSFQMAETDLNQSHETEATNPSMSYSNFSSPDPPSLQDISCLQREKDMGAMTTSSDKKQRMYIIKRKVIKKRKL